MGKSQFSDIELPEIWRQGKVKMITLLVINLNGFDNSYVDNINKNW